MWIKIISQSTLRQGKILIHADKDSVLIVSPSRTFLFLCQYQRRDPNNIPQVNKGNRRQR